MNKIYGLKMLREDGGSLNDKYGRVIYPVNEWITVPGNGAYIAISDGLTSGGCGPLLAWFECEEEVRGYDSMTPEGVKCYRRVKRLANMSADYDGPIKVVREGAVEGHAEGILLMYGHGQSHGQTGGWVYCWDNSQSIGKVGGNYTVGRG